MMLPVQPNDSDFQSVNCYHSALSAWERVCQAIIAATPAPAALSVSQAPEQPKEWLREEVGRFVDVLMSSVTPASRNIAGRLILILDDYDKRTTPSGVSQAPPPQHDVRLMTDKQLVDVLNARAAHDANSDF